MKKAFYALCFLLPFYHSVMAAEKKVDEAIYEIPPATKDAHEIDFYEKSADKEDALRDLQLVVLVDHSGSQRAPDKYPIAGETVPSRGIFGEEWTQWDNTMMATKYLIESVMQYDADGKVPVVFFGNQAEGFVFDVKQKGKLLAEFVKHKPSDQVTNLHAAIEMAVNQFGHKSKEASATDRYLYIVLTDGAPNTGKMSLKDEQERVKKLLASTLAKDDPKGDRLNMLLIRIGDDKTAKSFLSDLDDCKEVGENVDTKSDNMMYVMGPKNLVLNAMFEHLDGQYKED